jgi:hypothetical protein
MLKYGLDRLTDCDFNAFQSLRLFIVCACRIIWIVGDEIQSKAEEITKLHD